MHTRHALVLLLGLSRAVHAGPLQAQVQVKPQSRQLEVTVLGAVDAPDTQLALHADDRVLRPTRVVRYRDGAEPMAFVLVMQGGEIYVGNDEIETDSTAAYSGVLKLVEHALDELALANRAPPTSTFTAISYATTARVRVATEPLTAMAGAQLGSQRDYRGELGTELEAGVELALQTLEHSDARQKLVFILGDGNATDNEAARSHLAALAREAKDHHVVIAAGIYKSAISSAGDVVHFLTDRVHELHDGASLEHAIDREVAELTDRMWVTFDAAPLAWDGQDHVIQISARDRTTDPSKIRLPGRRASWATPLALGVIAIALLLIGGAIGTMRARRTAARA